MKTFVNSWFWVGLLCATLGLAPFSPEPHLVGKLRWIDGGAIGMKLIDWWDFFVHFLPFLLLTRLFFRAIFEIFEKYTKMKYLPFLILFSGLLSFQSCAQSNAGTAKTEVAAFEYLLKKTTGAQLIDVRTPAEFAEGHLENAKNINFNGAKFDEELRKLDPEKDVFVYCAVGGRSAKATEKLRQLGFKKIHELQGGTKAWSAAGKPLVK